MSSSSGIAPWWNSNGPWSCGWSHSGEKPAWQSGGGDATRAPRTPPRIGPRFFVRSTNGCPAGQGIWRVVSRHPGGNRGYAEALRLFTEGLPVMALMSEAVATAVGAPFLRSDFFVGSAEFGIRLNEVAYGSSAHLMDCEADKLAAILQQGYKVCKRAGSEVFEKQLAAESGMSGALLAALAAAAEVQLNPVPAEECITPRVTLPTLPQHDMVANSAKAEGLLPPPAAGICSPPVAQQMARVSAAALVRSHGYFPQTSSSAMQSVVFQRVVAAPPKMVSPAPLVGPVVSVGYRR
mmetsp:Transcript_40847/g.107222  ORF Transcript_40847/g.107222 Transcript_40847/m.107222 type:complete len:294 (+) Transcript_40847:557-1438(+)